MKQHTFPIWLVLLAALLPGTLAAQARSNVQGTIDSVMLDDRYIVIDGEQLPVREADLVITYKGDVLRASLLSSGMSVFYSTRADGSVSSITLIGPAEILEQLNAH